MGEGKMSRGSRERPMERHGLVNSMLETEEVDFPRGKYKAPTSTSTSSATTSSTVLPRREDTLPEDILIDDGSHVKTTERTKKRKASTTAKGSKKSMKTDEDGIESTKTQRIEHLNLKRVVKGMRLVGRISQIHPLALIISLPNLLEGHIPITAINDFLTEKLEDGSDDDQSEDGDDTLNLSLDQMFSVGQILPVQVTAVHPNNYKPSTGRSLGSRSKGLSHNAGRIELTANPRSINDRLSPPDLVTGFIVMGSVSSVEDHGYIVDLGLEKAQGFIPMKKVTEGMVYRKGSQVVCSVDKPMTGRSVHLVPCGQGKSQAIKGDLGSIDSVRPGLLVEATVTSISPEGLCLRFMSFYSGTVDLYHYAPDTMSEGNDKKAITVGQTVAARIVYEVLDAEQKRFALSLQENLVKWREDGPVKMQLGYPIGRIVKDQIVARVDTEWGLVSQFGKEKKRKMRAFTHISDVSDEHIISLSPDSGKYAIGTKHTARVMGYAFFNELVITSMADSIVSKSFVQVSDLVVGSMIKGTIKSINGQSIFLDIGGVCDAIVWARHFSDVILKKPERKYRPGMAVRGRIFSIDPEKDRVSVSLKKTLIESENVASSSEEISAGKVIHAVVTRLDEKGCSAELFTGRRIYIPIREAKDTFTEKMSDVVSLGQAILVRIVSVDNDSDQAIGSLKLEPVREAEHAQKSFSESTTKRSKDPRKATVFVNPVDPSLVDMMDCTSGRILQVRIKSVKETQINVAIADNLVGRVHVSETYDEMGDIKDQLRPLKSFHINQIITVRIIGWSQVKRHDYLAVTHSGRSDAVLDLTLKPSELKADREIVQKTVLDYTVGQKVLAFVNQSSLHEIFVNITPTVRGRISTHRLTSDTSKLNSLQESFPLGSAIELVVESVDVEKDRIHLRAKAFDCPIRSRLEDLQIGDILPGRIAGTTKLGLLVQITDNVLGRAHLTEITDEILADPLEYYAKNTFVSLKVIKVDRSNKLVDISLRPSVIKASNGKGYLEDASDLKVDQKVHGYVRNVSKTGLFVDISFSITARVKISEMFDDFIKDWQSQFQVGQLVTGKVLLIDPQNSQVELTLKSKRDSRIPKQSDLSGCKVGEILTGTIRSIEDYGAFIRIKRSSITGLCHKSECTDQKPIPPLSSLFILGDEVMVKVIKVDQAKKRLSLSMRPSVLLEKGGEDVFMDVDADADADRDSGMSESNDVDDTQLLLDGEGSVESDDSEDEETDEANGETMGTTKIQPSSLALASGFDWNAKPIVDTDPKSSQKTSTKKNLPNEADSSAFHEGLTEKEQETLAHPDRSDLWVHLMAMHAEAGSVEQARAVARRAIATINHRKEEDKLNVWLALLNLEVIKGSHETLDKTFEEAVSLNEPKTTYLRHIASLDQEIHSDRIDRLFKEALKKFKHSSKVWVAYGQYLFKSGRSLEAGSHLTRCLEVLPKRKHIKTILQFARMEYKEKGGSPERGRTLFEGLLGKLPKRTDIWTVYIDMELKCGDKNFVRSLFERVLFIEEQQTKISNKAAKNLFKKWLAMEKDVGNDAQIEAVKSKARTFVEGRDAA